MIKKKLTILYEDKYIIVVNKPTNLLTIASGKEQIRTLYHEVLEYLHKKNQKVFIVHRLDKDTSGLILFAKTPMIKSKMQNGWSDVTRKYYTIVMGTLKDKRTLKNYIVDNEMKSYITNDEKKGKLAITNYVTLKNNKNLSLLDINILTGRHNQIRLQLSNIGYPIMGDKKYGSKNYSRLLLHAYYMKFKHPVTNQIIELQTSLPSEFKKIIGETNENN